jgi:hypothetical protein
LIALSIIALPMFLSPSLPRLCLEVSISFRLSDLHFFTGILKLMLFLPLTRCHHPHHQDTDVELKDPTTSLALRWCAPTDNGGVDVVDYEISYYLSVVSAFSKGAHVYQGTPFG